MASYGLNIIPRKSFFKLAKTVNQEYPDAIPCTDTSPSPAGRMKPGVLYRDETSSLTEGDCWKYGNDVPILEWTKEQTTL